MRSLVAHHRHARTEIRSRRSAIAEQDPSASLRAQYRIEQVSVLLRVVITSIMISRESLFAAAPEDDDGASPSNDPRRVPVIFTMMQKQEHPPRLEE